MKDTLDLLDKVEDFFKRIKPGSVWENDQVQIPGKCHAIWFPVGRLKVLVAIIRGGRGLLAENVVVVDPGQRFEVDRLLVNNVYCSSSVSINGRNYCLVDRDVLIKRLRGSEGDSSTPACLREIYEAVSGDPAHFEEMLLKLQQQPEAQLEGWCGGLPSLGKGSR